MSECENCQGLTELCASCEHRILSKADRHIKNPELLIAVLGGRRAYKLFIREVRPEYRRTFKHVESPEDICGLRFDGLIEVEGSRTDKERINLIGLVKLRLK